MSAVKTLDPSPSARAVADLAPQPVTWLWPGRFPAGKLSLLMGDPQLGKSLLTLDLCARLSAGRPWPDDTPGSGPAAALVINGEDGEADTIRPRLHSAGADLGRCFVLTPRDTDAGPPLSLPGQTGALHSTLEQTHARLVVIDPVGAFLAPGVILASDQSVRRALRPLALLAEAHGCAVLLVLHLNKRGVGRAIYRGLGSIGLVAACRSAWLVAADPKAKGRAVFAQVKNNLGPPAASLAYEIRADGDGAPTLAWQGPSDYTADELVARPRGAPPAARASACRFLADALRDGPRTLRDLWDQAKKLGFSSRTMRRAAKEMDLETLRGWEDNRATSYWALPGQQLARSASPDDDFAELDRFLKDQRERYPPPTPLDEP
jgi:hypothetical protein